MTCHQHLNGGDMVCVRTDDHDPEARGGHVYHSRSVPDGRHDDVTGDEQ